MDTVGLNVYVISIVTGKRIGHGKIATLALSVFEVLFSHPVFNRLHLSHSLSVEGKQYREQLLSCVLRVMLLSDILVDDDDDDCVDFSV